MTDLVAVAEPAVASALETGIGVELDHEPAAPRRRWAKALLRGRGLVGLILVAIVVLAGVLAPLLSPYPADRQLPNAMLLGPSAHHLFGTDEVGHDVLSRSLYGIRIDALIIFVAVPVGAILGSFIGLVASQLAVTDVIAQRIFDVLLAFPALVLAIALCAIMGPGAFPVGCVVVAVELPLFGRLVRSAALKVRELPYVEAATVIGATRRRVLLKHVIPNLTEPIVVQLALSMSGAVFIESSMNFIGIGVRPPAPSLGSILSSSVQYLSTNPMYAVGPLIILTALILGFQLVAQALGAARRR